ncbi:MAG TPA: bifunctional proline dehydrogenase/L-glutamate gamma-semialdehyde dehydrogenase PutA, partial [Azonexus sp.]
MADQLMTAIRQACRRPEAECVNALVGELEDLTRDRAAVRQKATSLVEAVRRQRSHASGVDHLMHEFSLSSQEGVALMCLAEALLRIPDSATVDRLIRDKISHGDWKAHLGGSPSLFVNAATWGLMLTGKLVAPHSQGALGSALTRVLLKGGEPLIRKGVDFAMRLLGQQFVMGEDIEAALARSRHNEARGYRHSFDMLGEAALTAADAERYCQAYETAIHAIGRAAAGRGIQDGPGISVKLSALHPRYSRSQKARVLAELLPRLKRLMRLARDYDIGFNIDAEEADRLELSLDLLGELAGDPELAGWAGMGFVVQAYQKRAPFVIDWLIALARRHKRRLMIRLVKGAYWDSEIKRAQVEGLTDYPVYTRKPHSDLAYLVCAGRLLAAGDAVFPQFATHNAHTLATVAEMARARGVEDYEFQCLHGMGEPLYDNVVVGTDFHRPCRIYAPVGTHETLLPYLVRRLLENGANSSFVNRIVDEAVTIAQLIEDPLDQVRRHGPGPHPAIALPPALYGPLRRNSAGLDLADEDSIAGVQRALAGLAGRRWQAVPLVAGLSANGPAQPVRNPARHSDVVGEVIETDAASIERALANAAAASAGWHATPAATRAAILLNAADLLEAERLPLISLCLREAGKT